MLKTLITILAVAFCCLISPTAADEAIDFETRIRPVLVEHCSQCHGATIRKAGLRLDAKHQAFNGSDSGPVIIPRNSAQSELLHRIGSADPDVRMPPKGEPLSSKEMSLLAEWIDAGADWPETDYDRAAMHDPRLDHWAWQPVKDVAIPTISDQHVLKIKNEVDHFILAKLQEKQLIFSEPADRRTLIRRLAFDLHGLPPSISDIDAFVNDPSPDAVERLVDRLLASPRYGERWARHWLDIAHYADTHGFERDQRRDNAWHYRDWVIEALNRDMPYDQFLRDQIAGDVLRPDDADAIAATGFLAAGPWDFVGQAETPSPVLKRLARADDLDDMVTQVMTATCGITINCARCHDHKLDPISQREYYSLWSVFAGVKRGDRILSPPEQQQSLALKQKLEQQLKDAKSELAQLRGDGWSLADIVGGGDGRGTGKPGSAIDPASGKPTELRRGFLEAASANQFAKSITPFIDGVVIPDGGDPTKVPISSTGIVTAEIPDTSGKAWDAIRNGPVNSQFSTELAGIDFTKSDHTLLSLHANSAITFDLNEIRKAARVEALRFTSQVGYFGQTPAAGASFHVLVDGELKTQQLAIGRDNGLFDIDVTIPAAARFLTLMATDNGNDISHDQICFADAVLRPADGAQSAIDATKVTTIKQRIDELKLQLEAIPNPEKIYAVNAETPSTVNILLRGSPEQPGEAVSPGTISCLPLPSSFGSGELSDAQRRTALADWITSPKNPLTSRVIVNRIWHHHFGVGLVDTPSDFGLGGGLPTHPELLDWLAIQLRQNNGSLKSIHRLICLSATWQQSSRSDVAALNVKPSGQDLDADNRLLWRQNSRRLDAESLRDAVLAVSGKLDLKMFGPGYRDFDYKEEYAPVYTYIAADQPELWRRSVYRFVVRTSPDPFLTTMDCPNAANLSPTRNVTTTALQSLALLNNEFMLKQASYFTSRLSALPDSTTAMHATAAFQSAFGRKPSIEELNASIAFIDSNSLTEFCRVLLNSNEFVYID
jgi:hypothetical protein